MLYVFLLYISLAACVGHCAALRSDFSDIAVCVFADADFTSKGYSSVGSMYGGGTYGLFLSRFSPIGVLN